MPSLEDLEGKPLQPEEFDDNEASSEEEDLKDFMATQKLDFDHKPKEGLSSETNNAAHQEMAENQEEGEEDYAEFDNVLHCVEEFEHQKANQKSECSDCDDSASDVEEANLIQKTLTKINQKSTLKKQLKPKLSSIKSPIKRERSLKKAAKTKSLLKDKKGGDGGAQSKVPTL
jgi:hypothetical protein